MREVETKHARLEVEPTGAEHTPTLEPIAFMATSPRWSFREYLTPEQARELGQALIDCAEQVETQDEAVIA